MIAVLMLASVFLAAPQDFAAPPATTQVEAAGEGPETASETVEAPDEPEPAEETPPANLGNEEEGGNEPEPAGPGQPMPYTPSAYVPTALTAPIGVDSYSRDYEGPKSDAEQRYESGIESGRANRQNQSQTLEGPWRVYAADNTPFLRIEFRAGGTAANRRLEGAWRVEGGGPGLSNSGFVDAAILTGRDLEINYFPGKARAPNILHLRRGNDGQWRGTLMTPDGKTVPVTLSPVR